MDKRNDSIYPSIFNDVIGPVMRGPSSSHCAAALRIGRMARDLMDGAIREADIRFHPQGSLATTHNSQGSDMGLFGGFLGFDADDPRLVDSETAINAAGINVTIGIHDFPAPHPNTYKITLKNRDEAHEITALSVGGGMIDVVEIDGVPVSLKGDYYETLIYLENKDPAERIRDFLKDNTTAEYLEIHRGKERRFISLKARCFPEPAVLVRLCSTFDIPETAIKKLNPVLPILSQKDMTVPFITCKEMEEYNRDKNLALWQLAARYESIRGGISSSSVLDRMKQIVKIMRQGIRTGLEGTRYRDRILGNQSGLFHRRMENRQLLDGGILNRMILYTTALMEVKSSMGVIVAAPTAGSCGGLPGACFGAADHMELPEEEIAKALLAAGMIGIFIAAHATFAAEVGGCQAECGAASGMAAAALTTLGSGSVRQALDAASMALQNIFGMTCDPVANRVEVPCLGKNAMAAGNALTCANMALADFEPVIPLDEVIGALDRVGKSLPMELRCTALGGLSVTETSKQIEKRLKN